MKSFLTNAALILMLVVAAAITANAQTFTVLYNFDETHGAYPHGVLTQGRSGNLYGIAPGSANDAVAFKIMPSSVRVLYKFDGGKNPSPLLTLGTDGNLYGSIHGGRNRITDRFSRLRRVEV